MKSVMVSIPTIKSNMIIAQTHYRRFRNVNKTCLPTKHCFLLSQRGAALTPLDTKAKKAFFTWYPQNNHQDAQFKNRDKAQRKRQFHKSVGINTM